MVKHYWLRYRGSRTWHKVKADSKGSANKKFLHGTRYKNSDVISRKTDPPTKRKDASTYVIPKK